MGRYGGGEKACPLYETKEARHKVAYKLFASTIFVGICLIWVYRLKHIPSAGEGGRWAWIGMFAAEFWFGLYWIITQSVRWNVIYRRTFKENLANRYGDDLPGVDIFVCTADPTVEPPILVMNTVLSVMSYNYPSHKFAIYLSDDGGSVLTFHALLEASFFSKHWIPFCKKFMVEPRSPEAYFAQTKCPGDQNHAREWLAVKKLYEDMKSRIEETVNRGGITEETKSQHKGFSEWKNPKVSKQDHQSIVQILIDRRDRNAVDEDGCQLPALIYVAREKRPQHPHNFKAGAMNTLIRVSAEISNGPIILNVDCDMYSNNSDTIREALCFFMDEETGHEVSYVQFPQNYDNLTRNDVYSNSYPVINKIELAGVDGYGGALYCGTGCFHRRESLCGKKYSKDHKEDWNRKDEIISEKTVNELEDAVKVLANCDYEKDTLWGKEMGLMYGCPVEDIITGLAIKCRGWKPVYYNPDVKAFLGVGPTTLEQALVQYKRWSEGMFQIFVSRYCPFWYAHGQMSFGAQMGYCVYLLWAPNSLATLYYMIVAPLCLARHITLYPQVSSRWFLPFAYVFIAKNSYSMIEALSCGSTLKAWWNFQLMWMIRRSTSYLFAFFDTIIKQLGFSQTTFAITNKVVNDDLSTRYEQEVMEFGSTSPMFTILSTLAILNLLCLIGGISRILFHTQVRVAEQLLPQIILCGILIMVNIPVYEALIVRNDKGRIPSSVMYKSIFLASLVYLMPIY